MVVHHAQSVAVDTADLTVGAVSVQAVASAVAHVPEASAEEVASAVAASAAAVAVVAASAVADSTAAVAAGSMAVADTANFEQNIKAHLLWQVGLLLV
jgi:hypothetical protein